jgi:hypothetical protein
MRAVSRAVESAGQRTAHGECAEVAAHGARAAVRVVMER